MILKNDNSPGSILSAWRLNMSVSQLFSPLFWLVNTISRNAIKHCYWWFISQRKELPFCWKGVQRLKLNTTSPLFRLQNQTVERVEFAMEILSSQLFPGCLSSPGTSSVDSTKTFRNRLYCCTGSCRALSQRTLDFPQSDQNS